LYVFCSPIFFFSRVVLGLRLQEFGLPRAPNSVCCRLSMRKVFISDLNAMS
jgi:hypothetical protein